VAPRFQGGEHLLGAASRRSAGGAGAAALQAPPDGSLHRARDSSSSEPTTASMARRGFLEPQPGDSWTGLRCRQQRAASGSSTGFPPFLPSFFPSFLPSLVVARLGENPHGRRDTGRGPVVWLYRAALGFSGRGMDGGQTLASAPKGTRRSSRGARASSARECTGRCRGARVRQPRKKKRYRGAG
jgi:hypothetical protein